jgi:glutathione peroxidase
MSALYDFETKTSDGKSLDLATYRGRPVLIVNTASRCGFTPQYEALEALHKSLGTKGLVVIGAPANEFGAQEPGTDAEIQSFCSLNYGVTFQLLAKQVVKGVGQTALFEWLTRVATPPGEIRWNFEKFLVHPDGTTVERFASNIKPTDPTFIARVEASLTKA